jgi:signal transduction histidine kinase/predicted MFS family arabinose efflux permease
MRESVADDMWNAGPQSIGRIRLASLIGTTVEFYDFYIFAMAASLVFGPLFFASSSPSTQILAAYTTFGIAFFARPFGGAIFGHYGDRTGRKNSLVLSLLLMGGPTVAIGFLPTYSMIGLSAPVLLCLLRFCQGLALGGGWAGAALMAIENAPPGWRGRFGMLTPLGVPLGFILANGMFIALLHVQTHEQFLQWGWRVPFLASAPLLGVGVWIRNHLSETPIFSAEIARLQGSYMPFADLMRRHSLQVVLGALGSVSCFAVFYITTAFGLSYTTSRHHFSVELFLFMQLGANILMAIGIITAGRLSDRFNPVRVLMFSCVGTIGCGVLLPWLLDSPSALVVFCFLSLAMFVEGFTNGPLGAWLPALFAPRMRYTGVSTAYNIGALLGGGFSPVIAQELSTRHGLIPVGLFLVVTGCVNLLALDISSRRETRRVLVQSEERYRSMFEQTHVSIGEIDLSWARNVLTKLQERGVTDLRAYFSEAPAFLAYCAQRIVVVDANDAALRLLDCASREEVIGPLARFLLQDTALLPAILTAMWRGDTRFERQVQMATRTGRRVTTLLIASLPEDEHASDRVVLAMIDITEREEARAGLVAAGEELARAGRAMAVGTVSASLAKELAEPLNALSRDAQACVDWLSRPMPDVNEASKAAQRAVNDVQSAAVIVDRTRGHLTKARRAFEQVDLRQIVHKVTGLFASDFTSHGITLHVNVVREVPPVAADEVEMQQVLVNILTNAVRAIRDASGPRKELSIEVASDTPGWVQLIVKDSGKGIADEHLKRLVQPFFTPTPDGFGMGLAICRSMVEANGGALNARNDPNGGAVFEVRMRAFDAVSL